MARHYLDHASTSPLRPEALAAMTDWLQRAGAGVLADPGRIHAEGLTARHEIEAAREQVGCLFGARNREVVFTSGATEAIAAAVWGAAERGNHLVVPAIEHSAVRSAAESLADAGDHRLTTVGVDATGRLHVDAVLDAVTDRTALVCIQWGNHEVGTLQPVVEVVAECRRRGILTFVDAATAAGHVPLDFGKIGCDLLALGAHKFGGPPGIGALLVRRGVRLRPLLRGGEQERARRAGFENGPAIAGFAAACAALAEPVTVDLDIPGRRSPKPERAADIAETGVTTGATDRLSIEAAEARRLTDRVVATVGDLDGVRTFGDLTHRLPHLVCLGIDGIEPQAVLLGLDQAGIAAHSGSSCSSESLEPSPVLEAMGVDAHRSLRISVGWNTTDADIDAFEAALPGILDRLRALAGDSRR